MFLILELILYYTNNSKFLIADKKSTKSQPIHTTHTSPTSSSFFTAIVAPTSPVVEGAKSIATQPQYRTPYDTLPLAAFHPLAADWKTSAKSSGDIVNAARPFSALYDIICKEKRLANMNYNQQRQSPQRHAAPSSSTATVNGAISPTSNGHSRLQSAITISRGVLSSGSDRDVSAREDGRHDYSTAKVSPVFGDRADGGEPASPSGKR